MYTHRTAGLRELLDLKESSPSMVDFVYSVFAKLVLQSARVVGNLEVRSGTKESQASGLHENLGVAEQL